MAEPLDRALASLRNTLLDPDRLLYAIASGRRHGCPERPIRTALRPVSVKAGQRLQIVRDDGLRPLTTNVAWGSEAEATIDQLLAEPFGSWHVVEKTCTIQLRVTKRGAAQMHRAAHDETVGTKVRGNGSPADHDKTPRHLLDPGDSLFDVLGGNAAKRRQVDAFLRALAATLDQDTLPSPLTVVDLGCGNAYLTFAAFRYLTGLGHDVRITGVDIRDDQRQRNTMLAERLGCADQVRFIAGTIADADPGPVPDVVLALHACDTATDDALARAMGWGSHWVLAAPCCHHEIATQLRAHRSGRDSAMALIRDNILRERFADVLTDALRAALLRSRGYHVDVVEFIDSVHTPRNVLLRAHFTGHSGSLDEYSALADSWSVKPALARLLLPSA